MSNQRFVSELRDQLVESAHRMSESPVQSPRRRRDRVAVMSLAAAATVLLVSSLLILQDPDPVSAGVEVTVDADTINVRLTDLETRPREIQEAVERAGLDVRVTTVPVGPSMVGKFVRAIGTELPPNLQPTGNQAGSFTGFEIPRNWPDTLLLTVGRPVAPGESYAVASDALQPGEPAACQDLLRRPLGEALDALERLPDLRIRVTALPGPGEISDFAEFTTWKVAKVEALDRSELMVSITEDGSWPFPQGAPEPADC